MTRLVVAAVSGVWLLFSAAAIPADETATEPQPAAEGQPQKSPSDENIDRELADDLLPEGAQETPADVLDRAVNQMRDVSQRIEAGQADGETRQMQQKVVDDLTRLIELLKNQPPPQSPPPDQNSPPPPDQQNNQQQQQQQNPDQQPQPQPQDQQQQDQQRRPKDGQDAEERFDEARKAREAAEARERMFRDIWGHLPEAVRNRLRNNFSEEYLPKYAPEVRKYFEELARRRRTNNAR